MSIIDERKDILYNLKLIYDRHKILDDSKSDFNIFQTIANPYDEMNLHSKFIYTILNEKKYGYEFLLSFLKNIGLDLVDIDKSSVKIEREKAGADGRLDLYIEFKANDELYSIAIENKIYAGDQNKQLDRYLDYLDAINKGKEKYLYYLTLDGHDPSSESCSNLSKVINISYSENILNWIGEAISISAKEAKLREALVQYEELLEKICGKDIDYTMEIKDYILKNADNYDFVKSIGPGLTEARIELQDKFWKRLEARLEEHLSREYGLDMSKVDKTKEIGTSNKWYSLNLIKKKSRYFGLIYNLGNFKNLGDLYLKVEIERNLIFGIRNVESHIENTLEYSNMLDIFKQNNFILTSHDSWLSYKHVKDLKGNRFDLYDIDKDFAETIMYDEKLDALISSCIEQIDELLKLVNELEKN
ncbi:PD-(D/E)XK nuclease family protein [Fenollaria massiliensis]|uniref:PD-(D/E)XK nuclease family protein n=1 Tax=Fenollaria massiliensis TaxID=938288 RepID=A0A9E7DK08_9FIRM|nr:PD-(D/E)XK nuclease family protein [Fenollaria massiliensis]UQK59266.1 PD-(D/E)XK nuclease family protein [Fenollaria massiliensis]